MQEWWSHLDSYVQGFYVAAMFFSVFFLWQLVAAVIGLGGHSMDITSHVDVSADHGMGDHTADASAHETVLAFKLLSVRSILAFFTLFTWSTAMYASLPVPPLSLNRSMTFGLLWGLCAMALVAWLLHLMRKMAESGNIRMESCVGSLGAVHIDIPASGYGEVRVTVSRVATFVRATAGGKVIKSGANVRVVKVLGPNLVEVESA